VGAVAGGVGAVAGGAGAGGGAGVGRGSGARGAGASATSAGGVGGTLRTATNSTRIGAKETLVATCAEKVRLAGLPARVWT
jgi:hypothetical protein